MVRMKKIMIMMKYDSNDDKDGNYELDDSDDSGGTDNICGTNGNK